MHELSKLFGSGDRVKLIRFFLANPDGLYDIDEIEKILKIKNDRLKADLSDLEKSDLVIKSKEQFSVEIQNGKSIKSAVREYVCYKLNSNFRFLKVLNALMFDFQNANRDVLLERFKTIGRCKLFILSGVFIGSDRSRLDILYVGEAIKQAQADKIVEDLNIETGKKLNIHILDIEEYNYRYKMYDRFLRDVLKEKNEVLINRVQNF